MSKFKAKTREEELELLLNDNPDFSNTKEYLADLINQSVAKQNYKPKKANLIKRKLNRLAKTAAIRFLQDDTCLEKDYKFSTYYTWYISQVVKQHENR